MVCCGPAGPPLFAHRGLAGRKGHLLEGAVPAGPAKTSLGWHLASSATWPWVDAAALRGGSPVEKRGGESLFLVPGGCWVPRLSQSMGGARPQSGQGAQAPRGARPGLSWALRLWRPGSDSAQHPRETQLPVLAALRGPGGFPLCGHCQRRCSPVPKQSCKRVRGGWEAGASPSCFPLLGPWDAPPRSVSTRSTPAPWPAPSQ